MYRHIFFDLDHTLWDFERNSNEALTEIYHEYQLDKLGKAVCLDNFLPTFHRINYHLWDLHDQGKIDKEELRNSRFRLIFNELGVTHFDIPARELSEVYLQKTPQKTHLIPHAKAVLDYLQPKYELHIITNGFPEIQDQKLQSGGIREYFDLIVTSENAGEKKPHPQIFEFAMRTLAAQSKECMMIGDNLQTDILGAKNAGLAHVFFNPQKIEHQTEVFAEIGCLSELMTIL
ncbi:MAG: YjjG family noncanonical pyrimidine nucleotidase [Microscillaceae bacterium]|jgi:putative hydrolase of the HAD superfamily|nr:YjjG family noncanonical pyrimidine nucleotidase [Microscillaceae bacterium]